MAQRKKSTVTRPYVYFGRCVKVVDGDTIDTTLDLGFNLTYTLRLRLLGINSPEKRGPERQAGLAATRWLAERILKQDIRIATHKDKTGKYGRMLATVYRLKPGGSPPSVLGATRWVNVNAEIVAAGHAVRYREKKPAKRKPAKRKPAKRATRRARNSSENSLPKVVQADPEWLDIIKNIKEVIDRAGMTQNSFAKEMGVSAPTVARWLGRGDRPNKPGVHALEAIARRFGIAMSWLVWRNDGDS